MSGEVVIRALTSEDTGRLTEIERRCFSCPWSERSFLASMAIPVSVWLGAESDGEIVGFIGAVSVAGEAEILDIAVEPECRCRGIGRTLLKAMLEHIKADGADTVFLDVRCSNAPALGLYRSFGFETYTVRKDYYTSPREDAFGMRLAFDS